MAPHKIIAATTTEALKLVREQVGGDALVLSTRDTPEGVEIVAISPEALAKMSQRPEAKTAPVSNPAANSAPSSSSSANNSSSFNAPASASATNVFKSPGSGYSNSASAFSVDCACMSSQARADRCVCNSCFTSENSANSLSTRLSSGAEALKEGAEALFG